ncbi:MAG TPA: META domain-containing protein [Puia sp.]|jgi:heat shock protein HslJ|nr:META domain-containing protein [Puia sp.]
MKTIISACLCTLLACQEPASHHPGPATDTPVASIARTPKIPDTTSLGGAWYLQPVLSSDAATGKTPSLRLDLVKKHFSGNTGCNNMSGGFWYSSNDSSLTFSDKIITTKMACPGYNEQSFLKSLLHANHYRLRDGILTLLAEDNTELSHWGRKPSTSPKSEKV